MQKQSGGKDVAPLQSKEEKAAMEEMRSYLRDQAEESRRTYDMLKEKVKHQRLKIAQSDQKRRDLEEQRF